MNRRSSVLSIGSALLAAAASTRHAFAGAAGKRAHAFSAAQLEAFKGRFYLDPDVLPVLSPCLKRVLGRRYGAFVHSIRSQNALRVEDGMLHGFGEQYDTGDTNASLFLLGPRGEVFAAIKRGSRIETFGDTGLLKKEPEADHIFRHFAGNAE